MADDVANVDIIKCVALFYKLGAAPKDFMKIIVLSVGRCRFLEENESGLRFRMNKIWQFTECMTPYNRPSYHNACAPALWRNCCTKTLLFVIRIPISRFTHAIFNFGAIKIELRFATKIACVIREKYNG